MSHRLTDYLSRETADYLDQLERVLAIPGEPDHDHILQLTRGARGSAEMAGFTGIIPVAERLEAAARTGVDRSTGWDEATRAAALETVRDLQVLVRAIDRWSQDEDDLARRALRRWDDLDGGSHGASREQGPEAGEIVPISSLFYDDDGPHVLQGPLSSEEAIVPIDQLLLKGEAALREALRLRPDLERLLADLPASEPRRLISELFELIELALPAEALNGE